jgi:hypothetical protein
VAKAHLDVVRDYVEQRYGCTILIQQWDRDYSICVGYGATWFVVSYECTSGLLHELGHVIDYQYVPPYKVMERLKIINELEAWRHAEQLADQFGLTLDIDYIDRALGSYALKGLIEGTLTEDKVVDLFWG